MVSHSLQLIIPSDLRYCSGVSRSASPVPLELFQTWVWADKEDPWVTCQQTTATSRTKPLAICKHPRALIWPCTSCLVYLVHLFSVPPRYIFFTHLDVSSMFALFILKSLSSIFRSLELNIYSLKKSHKRRVVVMQSDPWNHQTQSDQRLLEDKSELKAKGGEKTIT